MGKKKRLIMKRRRFGRKFANHPALKSRAAAASVSEVVEEAVEEVVVEEEVVIEEDSVVTSNAYVSVTDDADLLLAILQELQEGLELPVAEEPAPVVKKAPVKRKTTKKRTTRKRSKRTVVKKDK
tara:strand:+ start:160 stop:534 length:375 start_codon:yes stop_codon:yes gene_type:complete